MPKLTLSRLRKMQALVRGFLFRRKILPKLLIQHRLCEMMCKNICDKISMKIITSLILEVITYNKYN